MSGSFEGQLAATDACWWPVAFIHQLKAGHPLGVVAQQQALVLFRDGEGRVAALPDRCPHRFAPLSEGQVIQGEVQCPYHGWRFNRAGFCTQVPGSQDKCSDKSLLKPWFCREAEGVIWVSQTGAGQIAGIDDGFSVSHACDGFWLSADLDGELLDAAENFLEAYHTHFVHSGWIRRDGSRQPVWARRRTLADGVEVEYEGETGQKGWLSRLLEPRRGLSWGRFRWPNLAEVEYRDTRARLTFATSAWFSPSEPGRLRVFARLVTRRAICPALAKRWLLRALFTQVLKQDIRIIQLVSRNRRRFADTPRPLDATHDLMGPALRRLLIESSLEGIEDCELRLWL